MKEINLNQKIVDSSQATAQSSLDNVNSIQHTVESSQDNESVAQYKNYTSDLDLKVELEHLSDSNGIRNQNHLVRKRILNHL